MDYIHSLLRIQTLDHKDSLSTSNIILQKEHICDDILSSKFNGDNISDNHLNECHNADDKLPVEMPVSNQRYYSEDEVAEHSDPSSCWIIVKDKVYDITDFLSQVSQTKEKAVNICVYILDHTGNDALGSGSTIH